MSQHLTRDELLAIGFESVGEGCLVSRDARFFAVSGTLGDRVRIDVYAVLTGHLELGDDVHVSPFSFLSGSGGGIKMGANSGISAHVCVYTKASDYSAPDLEVDSKLTGAVEIGENSIVGTGCTVLPGVTVGANVSMGCNCIIGKDVEEGSIIVSRGTGLVTVSRR